MATWEQGRKGQQATVSWQFTTVRDRRKLEPFYRHVLERDARVRRDVLDPGGELEWEEIERQ